MDQILLLIVLAALAAVLTASQYLGGADDEGEEDEEAERDPVARQLRVANYGSAEASDKARRQLLAVGPSVAPALLERLLALGTAPATLHPRAQRFVEEVLTDFGAGGYVAIRQRLRAVDPLHPAAPGVIRVLAGAGAPALEQLVREDDVHRFRFLLPAVLRIPEPGLMELVAAVPHFSPELRVRLAEALVGRLACEPDIDATHLPDDLVVYAAELPWHRSAELAAVCDQRGLRRPVAELLEITRQPTTADAERTEGPGLAAVLTLASLAATDPDRAAPIFARRIRAGSWSRDGEVALRACVRLLGARAERVVVEQLRHGRDLATELACAAMIEVDASRHVTPLLAVIARPRTDRCALVALSALLRARPAVHAEALSALTDGDVDVRTGAAWFVGVVGLVPAVESLAQRASLRLGDRAAMLQAIERIGAAAGGQVARAEAAGLLLRDDADAARVSEMVTLLAAAQAEIS